MEAERGQRKVARWSDVPSPPLRKQMLLAEYVPTYERAMAFFHSALVEVNINIHVVERILAFPLGLFTGSELGESIFFGHLVDNSLNASLLLLVNVFSDPDKRVFTLRQLKNELRRNVKPEYQEYVDKWFRLARVAKRIDRLITWSKNLRNKRVAHFDKEYVLGTTADELRYDVNDLKALRDAAFQMLRTLYFDVEPLELPLSYENGDADIDLVLDAVARYSPILDMARRDPPKWEHVRKCLSDENMAQLNRYRQKFGLTPLR